MQPPVVAVSLLSRRGALGVVARLSAWPLAWTSAQAIAPGGVIVVAAGLALATLMASTVASSRSKSLSRAGLVTAAAAIAVPTYAALRGIGWLGLAIGVATGVLFAAALAATKTHDDAPLDAYARAHAPVGAWIAASAVVTRFAAEEAHLHRVLPAATIGLAIVAAALALVGVTTFVRQLAWTRRLYRGDARPLRVGALPDDAPSARRLAEVAGCDAAIVAAPAEVGPYRASGDRVVVARVPIDAGPLLASHRRALGRAAASAAIAACALFVVVGPLPSRVHAGDTGAKLPALPGACATSRPTLHFVALEPLRAVSIEAIADHYRRAGIADVAETRTLLLRDRFVDSERDQIVAEDIADAARAEFRPGERDLVIVVTDHDMYLRTMSWRWAFAHRNDGVAVVSVARMDPSFPWSFASSFRPQRPECGVDLDARAHKMITRQILFAACRAPAVGNRRSARRSVVLSLGDLDAIDESAY